jgi:hypothetical protein
MSALLPANDDYRRRRLRRPEDFAGERGGYAPWCGPTAVATAAGLTYASACDLLTRVAPERYPPGREIVTAWWRDLVAALGLAGVPAQPQPVEGRPTLCQAVKGGLPEGWWLTRVTGHFCLVEVARRGTARVFDNRLHAAPLSARTHGRRRVTHLAALPAPPGAE